MQLSYEITVSEWKSALKLHSRQSFGRRIHWFIYDYVIPGITIAFLILTLAGYLTGHTEVVNSLAILDAVLVTMTALLMIVRRSRIRAMFRSLIPPTAKSRTRSITLSSDQIVTGIEGVGETRYVWGGIFRFVQNEKVALFYVTEEQFLLVPLRMLTSEQRTELKNLVDRHVTSRKSC